MNGADMLRYVDQMHRDKSIPKDVIFGGIEAALQQATERLMGEDEETEVSVSVDRSTGVITAKKGEQVIGPEEMEKIIAGMGRIVASSVKQMMIQKIREAEAKGLFDEYSKRKGELVDGTIQRLDAGTAIVSLGKTESLLPRSEQIPGETHHVNERVKAIVMEVRMQGHRVRIILSRCHPDFVRCLFEREIPEIEDGTIQIKAVSREAGYRSKIAVSSIDMKVDCVGACVGVRGSRIKNIIEELGGERIDIVRWNDSVQVLITNSLQPATIDDVFLYPRLGRAVVLVQEDQLSLAIGRRGQNVRLASKLVGWDIEIMTVEELNDSIDRAEGWFSQIPGVTPEMVEAFITEGFLSYTDLTFFEPTELAEMAGVSEDDAEEIIAYAEEAAEEAEEEEQRRVAEARNAPPEAAPADGEAPPADAPADGETPAESADGPAAELAEAGAAEPPADAELVGDEAVSVAAVVAPEGAPSEAEVMVSVDEAAPDMPDLPPPLPDVVTADAVVTAEPPQEPAAATEPAP
jgi:transcription termination/antitermination protein NusA